MKKSTSTKKVAAPKKAAAKKTVTKSDAKKCACTEKKGKCECTSDSSKAKKCDCTKDGGKCDCSKNKGKCKCGNGGKVCLDSIVQDVFSRLSDTEQLSDLLKDYFYTELLKLGFEDAVANVYANRLDITIASFEANIDIVESE